MNVVVLVVEWKDSPVFSLSKTFTRTSCSGGLRALSGGGDGDERRLTKNFHGLLHTHALSAA